MTPRRRIVGPVAAVVSVIAVAGLLTFVAAPALPASPAEPGTVLGVRTAPRGAALAEARRSLVLTYLTRAVDGRALPATGLVLVPRGPVPPRGWPLVVYGHMTTGAGDVCAPTGGVVPAGDDRRRAEQGDALARRLLAAGVAVIRPDFEGLGVPGGHPYLQGPSLGRSMVDMVAATRRLLPLSGRWVSAGHSEGAVAALQAADSRRPALRGMSLRGVAAFTPVTQMERLVALLQSEPVVVPGATPVLTGLAALLLKGLAVVDPAYRRLLLEQGGLSPAARALWPQLETRCLAGLGEADSWGGLAPAQILGPRGSEASRLLQESLARQDVRRLRLRDVPVRIDEGVLDEVAPAPFTEQLAQTYRAQGLRVTLARWPAGHSDTVTEQQAVPQAAAWILARLGR